MTPHTAFHIGSIGKTFTALAILQLRDQGRFRLDDPLKRHLPGFQMKTRFGSLDEITIRSLLTGKPERVAIRTMGKTGNTNYSPTSVCATRERFCS